MDAARAAVSKITGRTGHTTEVHEVVNPAVTRETVKPMRHEETTQAIDKEVHQDHYHTTVQPLAHKEVLPEQHSHQMAPVQERSFTHGDHEGVKRDVAAELGQFKDTSIVTDTQHTRSAAATVAGEHVHHHVHEHVQPVIHKETIQPEVVHTTVPIHETHHAAAQHHGMSALPMKTLDEFKAAGASLHGSTRETHEEYEGAPRPYNKDLQTSAEQVLSGTHHGHHGHHNTSGTGVTGGTGLNTTTNTSTSTRTGTSGEHMGSGPGVGTTGTFGSSNASGNIGSQTSHSSGKPSLMDKLNPKVDADGDGKAGFMK